MINNIFPKNVSFDIPLKNDNSIVVDISMYIDNFNNDCKSEILGVLENTFDKIKNIYSD